MVPADSAPALAVDRSADVTRILGRRLPGPATSGSAGADRPDPGPGGPEVRHRRPAGPARRGLRSVPAPRAGRRRDARRETRRRDRRADRPGPARIPGQRQPAPGPGQGPRHRNAAHPRRPRNRAAQRMARHPARARNRLPDRRGPGRRRRATSPPTPAPSTGAGDRALVAAARAAAYRLDPRSVTQRAAHAATERHVSLRPAPDTMACLTALLPVAQGVAVYTALTRHADTLRAAGDPRTRGQAHGRHPRRTHHRHPRRDQRHRDPAHHDRPHPLPGRRRTRPAPRLRHRPRRLGPGTAHGHRRRDRTPRTATSPPGSAGSTPTPAPATSSRMDSRARIFPPGLRRFIHTRDDTCRTPYCDAPIRHLDHIIPHHAGGQTTSTNGAGLCEACNHTKETPGWKARATARRAPGTPSNSPPPPATPTTPPHHPCPGHRCPARRCSAQRPEPGSRQRRQLRHRAKALKTRKRSTIAAA